MTAKDFPGNLVVKTPLAEAGDVGSIPDSVRPHMLQATKSMRYNHWAHALEPVLCSKRNDRSEKPADHKQRNPPLWNKDPVQ